MTDRPRRPQHNPEPQPVFEWRRCPAHPQEHIAPSVILAAGAAPWCIGDAADIRGHAVAPAELEMAP